MEIKIRSGFITLAQFLKHADLISTGGQAKAFIASNQIKINSEAIHQRGKKIYPGDIVRINNNLYKITGEKIVFKNT